MNTWAVLQAMPTSWPDGPCFEKLFDWHNYNASTLLAKECFQKNFIKSLQTYDRIVLHEDYAGSGNCGTALVTQYNALKGHMLNGEDRNLLTGRANQVCCGLEFANAVWLLLRYHSSDIDYSLSI